MNGLMGGLPRSSLPRPWKPFVHQRGEYAEPTPRNLDRFFYDNDNSLPMNAGVNYPDLKDGACREYAASQVDQGKAGSPWPISLLRR